jgi:neutral ceramidase
MPLKAGFGQVDITPKIGINKAGWLKYDTASVSDRILDPLFARAVVLQSEGAQTGIISLDVLSIRWTQANNIRKRIQETFGFVGANIMIAATHNHAGPATVNLGDVRREEGYLQLLEDGAVQAFQRALAAVQEAQLGFGHTLEWQVGFNRRIVMRDGTARMKGSFAAPNSLYLEGPMDPEVGVIAVRSVDAKNMGLIVNFACHPIHHGGDTAISAGFPGVLARKMEKEGWPQTMFLNGACGNISHQDPTGIVADKTMEMAGETLANDAVRAIEKIEYSSDLAVRCVSKSIRIPFRMITEHEVKGTTWGAQRAVEYEETSMYDRDIPRTIAKIRKREFNLAEVQALRLNGLVLVAIPAEFFVESGLWVKKKVYPLHALIVTHANGMIGYVPTQEAFLHGGYETTFAGWSRLSHEAAELITTTAVDLLSQFPIEKDK